MLAQTHRLGRTEFGAIPKGTKGYSGKFMKIVPMFVSTTDPKMGIVVSRKQCGNSVERGRVRRRLYAAFRAAGFLERTSVHVVVVAYREIGTASFAELVKEARYLLDKVKFSGKQESRKS